MFKITPDQADFALSSYNFELPEELIAQNPSPHRGEDALYLLDRSQTNANADKIYSFAELPALLPKNSLLIANNSKVAKARLLSSRPSGGVMEVMLLSPPPLLEAAATLQGGEYRATAQALLRPAKKIKMGERYQLAPGLGIRVVAKHDFGQAEIELLWEGSLAERIAQAGELPLPPYIKRHASAEDAERYQTIYADSAKAGSLAAPTAGLHFTPEIKKSLAAAGHSWAELTLFVGYGTFSPVRTADIRQHQMHAEYAELDEKTVELILKAKAEGRPVIAIGTTSARVLEAISAELAEQHGPLLAPKAGWVNCFIYPGQALRVVDGLITNFHLPESTLLMLVSALTGRERLLDAYQRAVEQRLHFFSYGDAMLIR